MALNRLIIQECKIHVHETSRFPNFKQVHHLKKQVRQAPKSLEQILSSIAANYLGIFQAKICHGQGNGYP